MFNHESNAEKARRLLAEKGRLCSCAMPTPAQGNTCGTIMGSGISVSYTGKKCTRCGNIIPATVH